MNKRFPFILFFINGSVPSEKEQAEADALGTVNVAFRNANMVPAVERNKKGDILSGGSIEACDGVAGEIPEAYSTLPTAKEAIAAFRKEERKEGVVADKNGDESTASDSRRPGFVPGTAPKGASNTPVDPSTIKPAAPEKPASTPSAKIDPFASGGKEGAAGTQNGEGGNTPPAASGGFVPPGAK